MPGYDTEDIIFKQPELQTKYTCPECNLLLHDAVQPSCGHWLCQSCADVIIRRGNNPCCPRKNCGEPFTTEDDDSKLYFPDRFVRKDVLSLLISCKFRPQGCDWSGRIGTLKEHLQDCNYSSTQCKWCQKSLYYSEIESHEIDCPRAAKKCPLSTFGCDSSKPMSMEELEEHLDLNKLQHLELMVEKMSTLEHIMIDSGVHRVPQPKQCDPDGGDPSGATVADSGFGSLGKHAPLLDVVEKDGGSGFSKDIQVVTGGRVRGGPAQYDAAQIADGKATSIYNEEFAKMQTDLKFNIKQELRRKDEEILSLKTTVQKLERSVRSKNADFEDRDFRLSLIENSNYDGTMVWKIPQFSQRMTDAQSGKYTSIFSLPFYTGRYGYKMCLRLYILGDGIGKGGYMSLFFVLMKGEFDNILQWPFTHKVTFKLLNQGNGRDIVDTFQPDPMSTSFRKPKSDMNIASGCPRFVSHEDLRGGGFIVDDTVFIKCMIETSTIKHP